MRLLSFSSALILSSLLVSVFLSLIPPEAISDKNPLQSVISLDCALRQLFERISVSYTPHGVRARGFRYVAIHRV